MKREYTLPKFRHGRADTAEAVYGKYSEDGAEIAAHELKTEKSDRIKKHLDRLVEEHGKLTESILLEGAALGCSTIEDLMIICFDLGASMEMAKSPAAILAVLQKKRGGKDKPDKPE